MSTPVAFVPPEVIPLLEPVSLEEELDDELLEGGILDDGMLSVPLLELAPPVFDPLLPRIVSPAPELGVPVLGALFMVPLSDSRRVVSPVPLEPESVLDDAPLDVVLPDAPELLLCFALLFFLACALDLDFLGVSAPVPAAESELASLAPADVVPADELSWRAWMSRARCSMSAARAGSVLSLKLFSALITAPLPASPIIAISIAKHRFFIFILLEKQSTNRMRLHGRQSVSIKDVKNVKCEEGNISQMQREKQKKRAMRCCYWWKVSRTLCLYREENATSLPVSSYKILGGSSGIFP